MIRLLLVLILLFVLVLLAWLMFSLPGSGLFRCLARCFLLAGFAAMIGMFLIRGRSVPPHWVSLCLCLASTFIYLLIILQFARLALLLPAGLFTPFWPAPFRFLLSGQASLLVLLLGIGLGGLGFLNALKTPEIRQLGISLQDLPEQLDGLRLVQLTDLHLGTIYAQDWVQAVVERTNALNPDLIVVTGDTGEYEPEKISQALQPLFGLRARLGVFYSLGNHEYYQNLEQWTAWYAKAGTLLRNSGRIVEADGVGLILAGLDDRQPDFAAAYAGLPADLPRILLAHQPFRAKQAAANGTDLMLSGHTHGGMLPGLRQIMARANGGFVGGLYRVGDMFLNVGNGTGLWTYMAVRLRTPAEITLIRLEVEAEGSRGP